MLLELSKEKVDYFVCDHQFFFRTQYCALIHELPEQQQTYIKVNVFDLELGVIWPPFSLYLLTLYRSSLFLLTLFSVRQFLGFRAKLTLLVFCFLSAVIYIEYNLLFLLISYFSCSSISFCSFLTQSVSFFFRYLSCSNSLTNFSINFSSYLCTLLLKSLDKSQYLFMQSMESVYLVLYRGDSTLLFLTEDSSYQIQLKRLSLVQRSIQFSITSSQILSLSRSLVALNCSFSCFRSSIVDTFSLSCPLIVSWQVVSSFLYYLINSSISLKSHCMTLYYSLKEVVCSAVFFYYSTSSSCQMRLMSRSLVLVRVVIIFFIQFILKVKISASVGPYSSSRMSFTYQKASPLCGFYSQISIQTNYIKQGEKQTQVWIYRQGQENTFGNYLINKIKELNFYMQFKLLICFSFVNFSFWFNERRDDSELLQDYAIFNKLLKQMHQSKILMNFHSEKMKLIVFEKFNLPQTGNLVNELSNHTFNISDSKFICQLAFVQIEQLFGYIFLMNLLKRCILSVNILIRKYQCTSIGNFYRVIFLQSNIHLCINFPLFSYILFAFATLFCFLTLK